MKLQITINIEGGAFDEDPRAELDFILSKAAGRVLQELGRFDDGELFPHEYFKAKLMDSWGNSLGYVELSDPGI